jgi:hypothetical protein
VAPARTAKDHVMSLRLIAITCSLVAASVSSLAFADEAYAPPAARMAPAPAQPPSTPVAHYAKPPPDRRAPSFAQQEPSLDRDQLRAILNVRRETNLAAFRAYAAAGVYPSNTYDNGALNVWRDRDGHLCAAATIINKSGETELVGRVADQNNFIKLADVKQGPLEDWILTSGFTQDEIVAIQKPFRPVAKAPAIIEEPPIAPDLKTAETTRLKKVYKQVDAQLVKDQNKSLDLAADRLFKHPTLAWTMLGYGPNARS